MTCFLGCIVHLQKVTCQQNELSYPKYTNSSPQLTIKHWIQMTELYLQLHCSIRSVCTRLLCIRFKPNEPEPRAITVFISLINIHCYSVLLHSIHNWWQWKSAHHERHWSLWSFTDDAQLTRMFYWCSVCLILEWPTLHLILVFLVELEIIGLLYETILINWSLVYWNWMLIVFPMYTNY